MPTSAAGLLEALRFLTALLKDAADAWTAEIKDKKERNSDLRLKLVFPKVSTRLVDRMLLAEEYRASLMSRREARGTRAPGYCGPHAGPEAMSIVEMVTQLGDPTIGTETAYTFARYEERLVVEQLGMISENLQRSEQKIGQIMNAIASKVDDVAMVLGQQGTMKAVEIGFEKWNFRCRGDCEVEIGESEAWLGDALTDEEAASLEHYGNFLFCCEMAEKVGVRMARQRQITEVFHRDR